MATSIKIPGSDKMLDKRLLPLLTEAEVVLSKEYTADLIDRLLVEKMPPLDRINTNFHYHRKAFEFTHIALRLCTESNLDEAMECYKPGTNAVKPLYVKFGHFSDNKDEKIAGIKSYAIPILQDRIQTCINLAEAALLWHTNKNKDEDHIIIDKTPVTERLIYNRMVARRCFEKEFKPEVMPQFYKDAAAKTVQFWMAQLLSSSEYKDNSFSAKAFKRADRKDAANKNPLEIFKDALMREMFNSGRSIVKTTHTPDDLLIEAVKAANMPLDDISLPQNMYTKCEENGNVSVYRNNSKVMVITRIRRPGKPPQNNAGPRQAP